MRRSKVRGALSLLIKPKLVRRFPSTNCTAIAVIFYVPNLEPHFSPNNFQIETHPKTLSQSHPSINSHRNPCLFHLPTLPSGIQNLGFFYLPKLRPLITLSRILDFAPNPTFGKARVLRSPIHYWFIYFNLGSPLIRKSKSFHFLFMFLWAGARVFKSLSQLVVGLEQWSVGCNFVVVVVN